MFGLGAVTSFLSGRFQQRMLQVSGVLVITLGILMLSRGLSLSGIQMAYASSGKTASTSIAEIKDDVQVVTTTMESGRYTPIIVQKGIPVKWTIKADARDLNGCNNPVTIPELWYRENSAAGDNVIEFTPQEEGLLSTPAGWA
jgi:plastocyanin domain-containing protein